MSESVLTARASKLARLRVPLAFLLTLPLFLLLTFPFDALSRRLESEARKAGMELTLGSLGHSLPFGVRARELKLKPSQPGAAEISLDQLTLSPELLGLLLGRVGVRFEADGYGGTIRGRARVSTDPKLPGLKMLALDTAAVDLKALPLQQLASVEAMGTLGLKADLTDLQPTETASGSASVSLKGAAVLSGRLSLGPGMGFALPKVVLGDIEGQVAIDKGVAKIEKLTARGADLDADVDGTIRLKPLLSVSELNLRVRVKPGDKWLDANPLVKGSLGFLGPRQSDGYWITLTGPLSRPQMRPGK